MFQFVIGDSKGNDLLCGREGEQFFNIKCLRYNCNSKSVDGDNSA